jgi:hypothetical protein
LRSHPLLPLLLLLLLLPALLRPLLLLLQLSWWGPHHCWMLHRLRSGPESVFAGQLMVERHQIHQSAQTSPADDPWRAGNEAKVE